MYVCMYMLQHHHAPARSCYGVVYIIKNPIALYDVWNWIERKKETGCVVCVRGFMVVGVKVVRDECIILCM